MHDAGEMDVRACYTAISVSGFKIVASKFCHITKFFYVSFLLFIYGQNFLGL